MTANLSRLLIVNEPKVYLPQQLKLCFHNFTTRHINASGSTYSHKIHDKQATGQRFILFNVHCYTSVASQ